MNIADLCFEEDWNIELIESLKKCDCKWEEFNHNYNELIHEGLKDELVYQLVRSGNLVNLSLLGAEWEEENYEQVVGKMRTAYDGEGRFEFVWSEEIEEEKNEEFEEDDDFK